MPIFSTGPGAVPTRALRAAALALCLALPLPGLAAGTDAYRLAVGDALSFDFLDDAQPAETLTVAGDGTVSLPLIGSFPVVGLSVGEAADAMRRAFVARSFFIDPQISLAVASFRPVYVLGDVRAPGSYAFQPMLTVEQAVALAGGQSAGGVQGEDRVVAQARLKGELSGLQVGLARTALSAARVGAQLAGRQTITDEDLPPEARGAAAGAIIASLMPVEQQILATELSAYRTRVGQLTAAVGEVEGALANLAQLAENQKQTIASAREDRERIRALYKRGIKTLTDMSGVEREVTGQESHLLEIYNQMSTTRREHGELQRQLSEATDKRQRDALTELQDHRAELERLAASQRATEEQILLLGNLATQEAREAATIVFAYSVRRREDGHTVTRPVRLDDTVSPGDTVVVSMERPSAPSASASGADLALATAAPAVPTP